VKFLSNLNVKPPLHEHKAPLLTTFWRRFWISSSPLPPVTKRTGCSTTPHEWRTTGIRLRTSSTSTPRTCQPPPPESMHKLMM